MGFFDKLKSGLNKTKESFNEKINDVFSNFRKVDEEMLEELEEILIMSDIGVDTSVKIIDELRTKIKKEKIQSEEDVKNALKDIMEKILEEYGEEKGTIYLTCYCTTERYVFHNYNPETKKQYSDCLIKNMTERYGEDFFSEYLAFKRKYENDSKFRRETEYVADRKLKYIDDSLVLWSKDTIFYKDIAHPAIPCYTLW